jgi:L-rhamnose-H+ transport protein
MTANPFLGILLHAVGGLAAASFYLPFNKIKKWSWESYWLVGGLCSWIIAPWFVGAIQVPNLMTVLTGAPPDSLAWSFFFGMLWGVGGLTFGLSVRYLGLSLGYALALGSCAVFGTLIPPIFRGEIVDIASETAGLTTLIGVGVCLCGVAVCGVAGIAKEKALASDKKQETVKEFNFLKGFWVAMFAGVMSACMAFAITAGKPIADRAVEYGAADLWKNTPVFIVIFAGGFSVNCVWCVILNIKNHTGGDYLKAPDTSLVLNYLLAASAGVIWYMQFMFYGMGTTKMGRYDFSSWTIHMAFIIVFSNIWGLMLHEWKGAGKRVYRLIALGLIILVLSTLVVGLGNYLKAQDKTKPAVESQTRPADVTLTVPTEPDRTIAIENQGALHDGT